MMVIVIRIMLNGQLSENEMMLALHANINIALTYKSS